MYLTKLEWDAGKACYAGSIGFGKIPVSFKVDGERGLLAIANLDFCKVFQNKNGTFLGNWSLLRVVLKNKEIGVFTLMLFDKESQSAHETGKPEGYQEPPF